MHQGNIFSFSGRFERAQQRRSDKVRVETGAVAAGHPLVPIEEEEGSIYGAPVAASANNMLSEMFNYASHSDVLSAAAGGHESTNLPSGYHRLIRPDYNGGGNRPRGIVGATANITNTNNWQDQEAAALAAKQRGADSSSSTAATRFFSMSPPSATAMHHHQSEVFFGGGASMFGEGINFGGGMRESQLGGPSLSLSSPLQQLEMRKGGDLRGARSQGSAAAFLFYNSQRQQEQQLHPTTIQQWQASGHQIQDEYQQLNMSSSSSYGSISAANVLRNSKYARAAQELLEEFCSVSRGHVRGNTTAIRNSSLNPTNLIISGCGGAASTSAAAAGAASSSSSKDIPPFYPPDRFENQRRKSRLLSMLDEVERRYNHYCSQMQSVVNSFDSVMGFGAAMPYAALARKAMSRHFRCLKDAIAAQLKRSCELLGENDGGSGSGLTKGETPKLRLIDQTLRQHRAFHQMGMMEQEAWRPQRGLPDRSVTVLRSWLFDHFLHPYPSDADKHLLARKTGLSRNQVSNWFINARVRLWKPMVEDMYQQEAKEEEDSRHNEGHDTNTPRTALLAAAAPTTQQQQQPHTPESDAPTQLDHYDHLPPPHHLSSSNSLIFPPPSLDDEMYRRAAAAAARTGDLSLTLGLRHAGGNAPDTGAYFGL